VVERLRVDGGLSGEELFFVDGLIKVVTALAPASGPVQDVVVEMTSPCPSVQELW
jgi:hypothetical protein